VVFNAQHNFAAAGGALTTLAVAMTLLAISYLVIQYLLALGRRSFAVPLLLAAVSESVAVLWAGASLSHVALAIVGVQALLLAGRVLIDLGCGPGAYTEALRARGAKVLAVDNDPEALSLGGAELAGAILADATALPVPDASIDGVVCSNLLEHTPDTEAVLRE